MTRVAIFASCVYLMCAAGPVWAESAQSDPSQAAGIILPAGTKIELAVIAPVWSRSAKAGDSLYTQVDFPVLAGKAVAIPPGTYVQGTIEFIARPSRFKGRAEMRAIFTTLIFANGYAVQLSPTPVVNAGQPALTIMKLTINVSSSNDLLLDNGAQFTITLAAPVTLDFGQLAAAIAINRPVDLGQFTSATQCRPTPATPGTPGTPGTPDTVIPGTPDTTIPGGPGMPDIVIPGTPPTVLPGTPGTPGTPGFPGRSCPPAPIVVSSEPVLPTASPNQSVQNP